MTDAERRELNREISIRVMGDDLTANTPERIEAAVSEWIAADGPLANPDSPQVYAWNWRIDRRCRMTECWHQRHGQPWQESIEAHVAAWRAEPPDYAGDLNLAINQVEGRIVELELLNQYCDAIERSVRGYPSRLGRFASIHATAEQRCRAALAAVGIDNPAERQGTLESGGPQGVSDPPGPHGQ